MKIKKGIVVHNFGDSYVAYDTKKSLMHELNESAYFILQAIIKKQKNVDIVDSFAKHFGIDSDQASLDFAQFLKTLKSIDVIE